MTDKLETVHDPQAVYAKAARLDKMARQHAWMYEEYAAVPLAAEVVRLHDALAAWGQMLEYQIKVDERDLDETWLDASETLKMLRGIIAGGPVGKQGL